MNYYAIFNKKTGKILIDTDNTDEGNPMIPVYVSKRAAKNARISCGDEDLEVRPIILEVRQ